MHRKIGKKSQITVFIIIGAIIILTTVLFTIYKLKTPTQPLISTTNDVTITQDSVKDFVESCIMKTKPTIKKDS